MMDLGIQHKELLKYQQKIIYSLIFVFSACLFAAVLSERYYIITIPFLALTVFLAIINFRMLYLILILSIPASVHFILPDGLALDVISEPLMAGFIFIFIFSILSKRIKDEKYFQHPFLLILVAHFIIIVFVSFFSLNPLLSIKFILAKTWFMCAFLFMPVIILDNLNDIEKILRAFFLSLFLIMIYSVINHAQTGFTFEKMNEAMVPFFSNHVLYSSTIAVFLPFIWYLRNYYPDKTFKKYLSGLGILCSLAAIFLSYTRASWIAILIAVTVYFLIRKNMLRPVIISSLLLITIAAIYLQKDNNYLKYTPDFNKTIVSKQLNRHLEATFKLEDISGMERVYRWVAAKNMIRENWRTGTGPNTFYPEYKKYAESAFTTYVSDNPEKSTTHNYFIMVFCEQGILGFLLFSLFCLLVLWEIPRIYKQAADKNHRNLVMACALSFIILLFHLMLNDLIETDKPGSLFFLDVAILIKLDLWGKNKNQILS